MKRPVTLFVLLIFAGMSTHILYTSSSLIDATLRLANSTAPVSALIGMSRFENLYADMTILIGGGVIQYGAMGLIFDKILAKLMGEET